MQSLAWIDLLRRIPADQHDNLMLVTAVGIEIAIQQIIRLEGDYLVIRGRLAGSSDGGRGFFIPFDEINYVGFQRPITEDRLLALFGQRPAAAPPPPAAPPPEPAAAPPPEPELAREPEKEPEPAPAAPDEEPRPAARPALANKAALLERLRARTRGEGAKPPEK